MLEYLDFVDDVPQTSSIAAGVRIGSTMLEQGSAAERQHRGFEKTGRT
jgi:hypothetical protein